MKIFKLQVILLSACRISAFTTQGGHRANVRAKLVLSSRQARFSPPHARQHVSPVRMVGVPSDTSPASTNDKPSLLQDTLAGLTVAFSLLSKAIACSAIVGVNPLVGLWSSVVMGITAPLRK